MSTDCGLQGEQPSIKVHQVALDYFAGRIDKQEQEKNEDIWSVPEYRTAESPGLINVERFIKVLNPTKGSSILDAGCGTGAAGLKLEELGYHVTFLDITRAPLNNQIRYFIEAPLWARWRSLGRGWDYGFCCDVLEHIPVEYTMLAAARLIEACHVCWFQIALEPDKWGPLVLGKPLHQTVQLFSWWRDRLQSLGKVKDARDLCHTALYIVERR